jgi:ribosomal protein S18 acetylase RimI-like enzyme
VNVALRPANPADEEFLFALFISSREYDLAVFPEPQRTALMRMQFRGQQQTFTQSYPNAEHSIFSFDGSDAGRVWVAETEDSIAILDIAILPAYRNQGIGAHIYRHLIVRAQAAGKPLHATVSTSNSGSLRFHERLGFQRSGSDGVNISLVNHTSTSRPNEHFL